MRRDGLIFERYKQIVKEGRKAAMLNGWKLKRGPLTFTGNVSSDGQSGEYMQPMQKYVKWFTKDGVQHRTDGPAYLSKTGNYIWYLNGKEHRDGDEPAASSDRGNHLTWYKHGKPHREDDKPAVVWKRRNLKAWYLNGLHHRLNGPAVEWPDGSKMWYIHGIKYSEKDFNGYVSMLNLIDKELNK